MYLTFFLEDDEQLEKIRQVCNKHCTAKYMTLIAQKMFLNFSRKQTHFYYLFIYLSN